MIAIGKALDPALRLREAMLAIGRWPDCGDAFANCRILPERGRFYIVSTFRCNNSCEFCSFRKVELEECDLGTLKEQIDHGFSLPIPFGGYSVSLTGGEPLIDPDRLCAILGFLESHRSDIRWIGIGTNGTFGVPGFLLDSNMELRLYISRHHYLDDRQKEIFGNKCLDTGSLLARLKGRPNIKRALTCNLIAGQIDSLPEVKRYLGWAKSLGVTHVVFRELNEVGRETTAYGDPETMRYLEYYGRRLVDMDAICRQVASDPDFAFMEQSVRPFIYHEMWDFSGMTVTFRRISEESLVSTNKLNSDIDELVLWPDGRLCGCWDYELKVLREPKN